MKLIYLIILLMSCSSTPEFAHFWYPISLKEVHCGSSTLMVYQMYSSRSTRSLKITRHMDASDKKVVVIGGSCWYKIIEEYPKHRIYMQELLTDEQRKHMVLEGLGSKQ